MFENLNDPHSGGSTNEETASEETASLLTDGVEGLSRRLFLQAGAVGTGAAAVVAAGTFGKPYLAKKGLLSADGAFAATSTALGDALFYLENFPTAR